MQPQSENDVHLIHVADEEVKVEFFIDDALSFVIFWSLGFVVFLQFFSRYVLNDSAAWTEEIARYLLMCLTFVGASIVTRRGTHIGVEVFGHMLPDNGKRVLSFFIDCVTVSFIALLCYFSILITQRMQIQRMTVIDVSMSVVYGGVALGCFLMLWRAVQRFFANAKRGWRPDPNVVTMIMD